MSYPASMTTVTLTADFRKLLGAGALDAEVLISSPSPLVSGTDNIIVPRANEKLETVGGLLSVELPASDDAEWLPNGFQYLVRAVFSNGIKMAWLVQLLTAYAPTQDLADFGVEVPYPDSSAPFIVLYPSAPTGGGGSGAVDSVNGRTGVVTLSKADVGLSSVDNTSDMSKPVSTAQSTAIATAVSGTVPTSRLVSAGSGLTGGGSLAADRSLAADFGTGVGKVTQGNDSRLSDARTPTAHAASHASGGGDPVTLAQSQVTGLTAALAAKADDATTTTALSGKQPLDADLTTIAGLTATTDNVLQAVGSAWASRTPAQVKTALAITQADVSGLVTALGNLQPLDADLTAIAGLTATTNNMIMSVASAWASRTPAQVKTALAIAESDVTNLTTDLAAKAPIASPTFTGTATAPRLLLPPVALTDVATILVDAALGNDFTVTLGGNRTLGNPSNPANGQKITFAIRQDGTGTRTLTLDTAYRFGTDITGITLTTTINKTDYLVVRYNGTDSKWDVVSFIKGY